MTCPLRDRSLARPLRDRPIDGLSLAGTTTTGYPAKSLRDGPNPPLTSLPATLRAPFLLLLSLLPAQPQSTIGFRLDREPKEAYPFTTRTGTPRSTHS
jgi:hypothetical protein